MTITTAQIRGARGILNWSQQDLAQRTGISATSIGAIENGQTTPRTSTLDTIRKTLENGGIEFIGLEGIKKKSGDVQILHGANGFIDFFDHVYETVKNDGGEVNISNVEESMFIKWAGATAEQHFKRMSELKNVEYKVLLREGDYNFAASSYAQYKWLPKAQFTSVPFYAYGKKLAILLIESEPQIIIHNYPVIAEAFRVQFQNMWENALIPTQDSKK